MKIVILEDRTADQRVLLDFLKKYICQTGYDITALACSVPEELPEDHTVFDAALLDIMICGQPVGVETARMLRERGFCGPIVFLTASSDYYAEGFEVDAVHYLIKPYTYEAFKEAMDRLVRQTGRPYRTVELPVGRLRRKVVENEILYIEVYGRETLIYTKREKMRVLLPLKEVEALLSEGPFLRCFRSYIVNMEHIIRTEENAFLLDSGDRVPVTLRNRKEIQEKYLEYRFEKMRRDSYE